MLKGLLDRGLISSIEPQSRKMLSEEARLVSSPVEEFRKGNKPGTIASCTSNQSGCLLKVDLFVRSSIHLNDSGWNLVHDQ